MDVGVDLWESAEVEARESAQVGAGVQENTEVGAEVGESAEVGGGTRGKMQCIMNLCNLCKLPTPVHVAFYWKCFKAILNYVVFRLFVSLISKLYLVFYYQMKPFTETHVVRCHIQYVKQQV